MKILSLAKGARRMLGGRYGYASLLTAVFLVIAGVSAWHHEFWRDEMQAWLIARDVPTLPALLEQAHYEGSPPLWSLILRVLTWITPRPEIVQVFNWALAGLTFFLIAAHAPFNRLQKLLLAGNYYLLFEYGTVCRNYLPGVLGLVVACIVFPSAQRRPWLFAAALAMAAMASVHSFIVAAAMAAAFWGERILTVAGLLGKGSAEERGRCHLGPLSGLAGAMGLAVYSILPRADTLYAPAMGWLWEWQPARLAKVASALVYAHFPWPRPDGFFWIPPWDVPFHLYDDPAVLSLAAAFFIGGVLLFRRHAAPLILYLAGTLGLAAFFYVKYLGFTRHTGFLFLVFFCAWWIRRGGDNTTPAGGALQRVGLIGSLAFTAMLAVQAIDGVHAVSMDVARPFSCGKAAAGYLVAHDLQDKFIAVGPDWAGAPLSGYLGRPVYYPYARRHGSFVRWDTGRREAMEDEEFYRLALTEAAGADMVIALDHPLSGEFMRRHGIEFLTREGGSLTPFEDYFLHYAPARK